MKNLAKLNGTKVLSKNEQKNVIGGFGGETPFIGGGCNKCNPTQCTNYAPTGYYGTCVPCSSFGNSRLKECRIYKK